MNIFKNLPLGKKLALSFGLVCSILAVVVAVTMVRVRHASTLTNQVITVRAPMAQLGITLQNGLNASLAHIRGYVLQGTNQFKSSRVQAWDEIITPTLARIVALSEQHTDLISREKRTRLEELVQQLRTMQDEIEQMAHSPENFPAEKLYEEQASPQAEIMTKAINAMVDEELSWKQPRHAKPCWA
jgi:methyl-accepting chemotaxis protein